MPSLSSSSFSLFRWVTGLTRTTSGETEPENPIECYACKQVGVPVFHTTRCEGYDDQPRLDSTAGSGSASHPTQPQPQPQSRPFGAILDPRTKRVQRWNRAILMARGVSLAVDALFFYALSLVVANNGAPCVYFDSRYALVVTVIRTCLDAVQLWHVWLQLKMAYVSRESLVVGIGTLVWDPRAVARRYLTSFRRFWFDVFVTLPLPQVVFWVLIPRLISQDRFGLMMTIVLLSFAFQYLPKAYHTFSLLKRMQKVTGYILGSVWWGFGMNLIAYLIAAHAVGACWYVFAAKRVVACLSQQCESSGSCSPYLSCSKPSALLEDPSTGNLTLLQSSICMDREGPFNYGIYGNALPAFLSNSLATRILYPIYWGLLNLSSFGNNLAPTSDLVEVLFSIFIVLFGLTLFTLLMGNIQVFLQLVDGKMESMQLRRRDFEWWMRRRQLPTRLRHRVRRYERQRFDVAGGHLDDEINWIEELPQGLRRDIKRFLCLDLIRKVPLFQSLDDLILDNICERLKPFVFSANEKIIREGDVVQRMVFIVHGRVKRIQRIGKTTVATSILEPGCFLGDELFLWCLRRPFMDRLPVASATFFCLESTELFALEVNHLRSIIDHYRYIFANEKIKRTARYYSSNWRTWAAVNIQVAWRRYRRSKENAVKSDIVLGKLKRYAVMFMSIRPHDHLE